MKIPHSIRNLYQVQLDDNNRLKERVDRYLEVIARQNHWHYDSRIKTEESVALKIESGRVHDPTKIEDFFACSMVVRNITEIPHAEIEINKFCEMQERRPHQDDQTHKKPDAFPFDDLRLYVCLKDDPAAKPSGLTNIKFEIQIKTFLQHAWVIATHDLVYKSDDVSWSKQRIAYHIKAMLEHAEVSIQEADKLAGSVALAKTDKQTTETKQIINILKSSWDEEELPKDIRRLAQNIQKVLSNVGISLERLSEIIEAEKTYGHGKLPLNLSPYAVIIQALIKHENIRLMRFLTGKGRKEKILILPEMEASKTLDLTKANNALKINH